MITNFKDKDINNQGPDADHEDLGQTQNNGISVTKTIQEFLNTNNTILAMNFLNLVNTLAINLIYIYRIHNMCDFDKNPVWAIPDDLILNRDDFDGFGLEPPSLDEISCNGQHQTWYYLYLLLAHIYFLCEFILKASVQPYKRKFLLTFDSLVEIATTVPFLITLVAWGTESQQFQFFVMLDTLRLFLYQRYTTWMTNEVSKESLHITLNVIMVLLFMAFVLQFIENIQNYKEKKYQDLFTWFDMVFFSMTTISVVGYGSKIDSEWG